MQGTRYTHPFLSIVFFFLACIPVSAQDLTGIWKGYFITETGEHYKLEFQVLQNKSHGVTGVSYSYLDVRFYGKATMTGNFVKNNFSFRIREIKTVEVKSTMGGGTCIMNYNFIYSRSGKEEFLEGSYLGKFENKYSLGYTGKWGDCGGGKVFLRKVNRTDFYIEPFLKNKIKPKQIYINEAPPVKKDSINATPVKKPVIKEKQPERPVTRPDRSPVKPVIITPADSSRRTVEIKPVKKNPPVQVPAPPVIRNRQNEVVKILTVHDPEVVVKLYDNGEIDGDTISVYLDNKLVLASKRLTAAPLLVTFSMEDDNEVHTLTMVAENLGSIPPNTSLMVVEAGDQRFDVRITSTEQKNAVVKFKYQKKEDLMPLP